MIAFSFSEFFISNYLSLIGNKMLKYRIATVDDAENLINFFRDLDRDSDFMLLSEGERSNDLENQKNIFSKIGLSSTMILCLDESDVTGCIVVSRGLYLKNKHLANLVLGVKKNHRNQGIGKSLISHALKWCRENKISQLELTVAVENKSAIACYLSSGFFFSGIRKKSLMIKKHYMDEYYMSRSIE